jgi:hypothetical protein
MKVFKSKRFWLNLATAGALILSYAGAFNIPAEWTKGIMFGIAAVNLVLQVWFNSETPKKA